MSDPKITFRGWHGHFICASKCQFSLNTLIEYEDIKIVVSTIGLLLTEASEKKLKYEEIGYNRHFETMAFHAKFDGTFWDADVSREVTFESDWCWKKPKDEIKANDGHYVIIEEICKKLKSGEIKE